MRTTKSKLSWGVALAIALFGTFLSLDLAAVDALSAKDYDLNAELQSSIRGPERRDLAPTRHLQSLSAQSLQARAAQERNQAEVLREKSQDKWLAALLSLSGPEPLSISTRFATWSELADYIQTNKALVELWADRGSADLGNARRLSAVEITALHQQDAEPPTFVTLTARDPATGQIRSNRLEFAYNASAQVLTALQQAQTNNSPATPPLSEPILAALHLEGTGTAFQSLAHSPRVASAIQEGGVVEQIVAAESSGPVPANLLEPQVDSGPKAVEEKYTQVLGDLLEWRHYLQRKALGLPMATAELLQVAGVLEDLTSKGITIDDTDALTAVDILNNTFLYRRFDQGQPRLVRITAIPGRADSVRDVAKAAAAKRVEVQERAGLAPGGNGIALIHRVREVDGKPEVGPLVFSENSAEGISSMLTLLDRLPVVQRARLRADGFSRTLIDADLDGKGTRDRFFLTLAFPAGKSLQHERINPLTGERELLVEQDGLLTQTITDARVVEIDYSPDRQESATRVYANRGSRQIPQKGSLLEETRTLETWQRDLSQPDIDPSLPVIAKSRVSHVTGETTHEIFGLFPLPVATVDEQFITYRQFNPFGLFVSAKIFDNGLVDQDAERPLPAKLNDPVIGRERFQLSSTLPPQQMAKLQDLKAQRYLTTVLSRDLAKATSATQTFDNAHSWRKMSESFVDRLDGTNAVTVNVTLEYRDNLYSGQIPTTVTERCGAMGKVLSQTETKSYDPFLKRRVAVEVDYTGKVSTNLWDTRWTRPIESSTAGRKTIQQFNRDETQVTGNTIIISSGEELSRFTGRFDPRSQHWQLHRVTWFKPGLSNQTQVITTSGAGRLLLTRTADAFESQHVYGPDGMEVATSVYMRNRASGQFNVILQQEDLYHWNVGEQSARVQRYVDGQLSDSFQRVRDFEGRTLLDERKVTPDLTLKTITTYDGWSDRPLKTETLQNNRVRLTRTWQTEERQSDGTCLITVKIFPYWGLTAIERVRVGDPLERMVSFRYENEQSVQVTQWFDGTAIPKTSELLDRHGHPIERFTRGVNAATESTNPCDLVRREKLDPWGGVALFETKAFARGTDLPLYSESPGEKVYFDSTEPFEVPLYSIDPDGRSGVKFTIRGQKNEHVLTLFRGALDLRTDQGTRGRGAESTLSLESIELGKDATAQAARRTFDRAGNLIDERLMTIPLNANGVDTDQALFAALAQATIRERFHFRYQPGWLVEQSATARQGKSLTFSNHRPDQGKVAFAVNEGGRRDWVTEIDGIRSAPVPAQPSVLKNYFFRRIHSPSQQERNVSVPGCSNLWTSWLATELAANGDTLFDSELVCDAQGHLSVGRTSKAGSGTDAKLANAYQLPERDAPAWHLFHLNSGTNSLPLDLGGMNNLDGCEFVYFYLHDPTASAWTASLKSASGREVRVRPSAALASKGEISSSPVASFDRDLWGHRVAPERVPFVSAPRVLDARDSVVLISVAELARAGLDVAHVSSATLQIAGKPGQSIKLTPIAPLIRESRRR